MANTNIASPALIIGLLAAIALSALAQWLGGFVGELIRNGLLVGGFFALMYAMHTEPVPEMWRRRLIMLAAGAMAMSAITG
ncbi:MAG: hypothetical protein JRH10_10425 [Deltaproteobacteria bacterium]|nr:hypothetical protein [Deltaproteobacteria bacterium]MBW2447608.1 hypothetical protein [Deltaproteobacteria bacterium]